MRWILIHIIGCLLWGMMTPLQAQQMKVEDFTRIKKPFWSKEKVITSKTHALLDLYTNEKGFEFSIGKIPLAVEEGEGMICLTLPDKTSFFTIKHPLYGQITWKIPEKGVRKKKRYQAYLSTNSPDKEYQIEKQWAIFYVNPANAILYVDSMMYRTRNGVVQVYVPIGKHTYKVESPFYKMEQGEIEMIDSCRLEKNINLSPFYSFLTIKTPIKEAEIYLDDKLIGKGEAISGRMMPGVHSLTIMKDSICCYKGVVELGAAERKAIELKPVTSVSSTQAVSSVQQEEQIVQLMPVEEQAIISQIAEVSPDTVLPTRVNVKAFDEDTEIWVNREKVGTGSWEETLPAGVHAISSRKDNLESKTQYIQIVDGQKLDLKLATPMVDYGMLNISSNQVNAEIRLNNIPVGKTPCIIQNLPVGQTYTVQILKEGYKEVVKTVDLKGNDIVNVFFKLKKR